MKTTLALSALGAALLLTPAAALAQSTPPSNSGAAAGAVPNSFDAPGQAAPNPSARPAPAPGSAQAGPRAEAPDIARAEEALRGVIAAAQGSGFDYSVFTTDLAGKIRQQSAQVGPLIKSFGDVKTVEYVRQEGEAQLFRVTFDNQVTEWMIGFDADDKIAALLFRPAEG